MSASWSRALRSRILQFVFLIKNTTLRKRDSIRRLTTWYALTLAGFALTEEAELSTRRERSAGTRQSPDRALRQSLITLASLEATLRDINGRIERAVHWTFMVGQPDLWRVIDDVSLISDVLHDTQQKIGEARKEYQCLRSSPRRTSRSRAALTLRRS